MSERATTDFACRLAGVIFASRAPINSVLADVAGSLRQGGVRVGGALQAVTHDPATGSRELRLRGLRGDWDLPILENRGREARGCRLDPQAISDVAGRLEAELSGDVEILILNRFGRAESEGYGLRQLLERAVCEDVPVLIGVREDYREAWEAFHGGLGTTLAPDRDEILAWAGGVLAPRPHQAAAVEDRGLVPQD